MTSIVSFIGHDFYYDSNYVVGLFVSSGKGCKDTVLYTINVETPVAGFSVDESTVNLSGNTVFIDSSIGATEWFWNFGDGKKLSSKEQEPQYAYTENNQYNIIQIVTNSSGCSDTAELIITISGLLPAIPTAFSPNGNTVNDVLYVKGGPYKELELKIYNEWGELIFISNSQSDGWDGTKDGVNQPVGGYIYIIHAITETDIEFDQVGDVMLVR